MSTELGPLRCCILGAGVLGRLLGGALQQGEMEIVAASSRGAVNQGLAAKALGVPVFDDPALAIAGVDLVLLTVPHAAVAEMVETIAAAAAEQPRLLRVISTCGLTPLSGYAPLLDAGISVAIVHPLRVFTSRSTATDLRGAPAAVTAPDDATLTLAQAFAHTAGLAPFELEDDQRALYHAAASIAGNGTVVLQAAALELARLAGVPDSVARNAFADFTRRTVDRAELDGAVATLTGAVPRGDVAAIETHLAAINAQSPQLAALYARVTEAAVRLAVEHQRISIVTAGELDSVIVRARTAEARE